MSHYPLHGFIGLLISRASSAAQALQVKIDVSVAYEQVLSTAVVLQGKFKPQVFTAEQAGSPRFADTFYLHRLHKVKSSQDLR